MSRSRRKVGVGAEAIDRARGEERLQAYMSNGEFQQAVESVRTNDSFQNFALNLGIGTNNALSQSTYGYNPITRNRSLLEWMYRGSWLAGVAVNLVADDMTRAGIEITSGVKQKELEQLDNDATALSVWSKLGECGAWARLYGGAIAVLLIDGQDMSTPLKLDTIGRGQFKGLEVVDRWWCEPSLGDLVQDFGPHLGMPKYYRVSTGWRALRGQTIHYSRVIRLDGVKLPYNQAIIENLWSLSELERLWDRMVAFDSATMGAAQLVYKSYLRTYKVKDLRKAVAAGGELVNQLMRYVDMMRKYQGIEGITLLDGDDEFEPHQQSAFAGINEALMQIGQQIAGALQIPLVRLFGMSPAGFSATGESDLKTYYDGIKSRQERDLRNGVSLLYRVLAISAGIKFGDDFNFVFRPLWQISDEGRVTMATGVTNAVTQAFTDGIVGKSLALKELKQSSRETGVWNTITDEDIDAAAKEDEMQTPGMLGMPQPGAEGAPPLPNGMQQRPLRPAPASPEPREGDEESEADDGAEVIHLHQRTGDSFQLANGMGVQVEVPKGSMRYPWQNPLAAYYGFFPNTRGADGDAIDCFVGDEADRQHAVHIIDQCDPHTGLFDEHKVCVGFPTRATALRAYQRSFGDGLGAARIGRVTTMPLDKLGDWLNETTERYAA